MALLFQELSEPAAGFLRELSAAAVGDPRERPEPVEGGEAALPLLASEAPDGIPDHLGAGLAALLGEALEAGASGRIKPNGSHERSSS
jgi:hypothetical protein